MNTAKKLSGLAIASAAAALITTGCSSMGSGDGGAMAEKKSEAKSVHCMGINACKGHSACGTADNACKGQNACKGKGWLPMSAQECEEKGGTAG